MEIEGCNGKRTVWEGEVKTMTDPQNPVSGVNDNVPLTDLG